MKPRPLLLALAGCIVGLSLLLLGSAVWGVEHSYEWELARCRALPDHYSPEWGWLLVITPLAVIGLIVSGLAILMEIYRRPRENWIPWAMLGFAGLMACSASALVLLYFTDPAISSVRRIISRNGFRGGGVWF